MSKADGEQFYKNLEVRPSRILVYLGGTVYCAATFALGFHLAVPALMFIGIILYQLGRETNRRSSQRVGQVNIALSFGTLLVEVAASSFASL